jgi:hypothetical protein
VTDAQPVAAGQAASTRLITSTIHRVASVVRDLDPSVTKIGAEAAIGRDIYVEVLQPTPVGGILDEWLTAHGEGVQHVGYWAPSIEDGRRLFREMTDDGTEVPLSAWIES